MEKDMMLAIQVPPVKPLKEIYLRCQKILKNERVKFYPIDQLVLILRYLPGFDVEFISEINRIIAPVITSQKPFLLKIEGIDIYPYKILPKVLWFRVAENQQLRQMVVDIDQKLVDFGFKPEFFDFYPHITFARIRKLNDKRKIDQIERLFSSFKPIEFTVNQIILYENIKKQKSIEHRVRNRFHLQT